MAKRQQGDGTSAKERGRRYTTGRVEEEREARGDGDGESSWASMDEDLTQASMEDLRELADELEIDDYESLSREELVQEIRRETRAEP